jgi:hypothetical protein
MGFFILTYIRQYSPTGAIMVLENKTGLESKFSTVETGPVQAASGNSAALSGSSHSGKRKLTLSRTRVLHELNPPRIPVT